MYASCCELLPSSLSVGLVPVLFVKNLGLCPFFPLSFLPDSVFLNVIIESFNCKTFFNLRRKLRAGYTSCQPLASILKP